MDISVVIAAHNQRDRLRLVLSGLAVQTFSESPFEVIVVDDGSTDGTGDFLRTYEHIPINRLAQEGGYRFPELKSMQDQASAL